MPANHPRAIPAGIRGDTRYFPELDGLRGLAIGLVLGFHADSAVLLADHVGRWAPLPLAFLWAGHTGVSLLFVLSAFLLSLPFLDEAYGGTRVSRRQFYRRRALRILPLYWVVVLLGTVITSKTSADVWRGLPYLAFLESKPNLPVPMPPFSWVWWSLATEVQFYTLLPLVALTFGRSRAVTLALLAVYAAGYAAIALGLLVPHLEPWLRAQSIIGRGPLFLFGMLAAWLYRCHGEALRARFVASRWLSAGGADLLLILVLIALGCLLGWSNVSGFMSLERTEWHVWHVLEGALWTLVLLIVLLGPLRAKALVSNRALIRLGVLSYSIYLLHLPIYWYSMILTRRLFPQLGTGWSPVVMGWFAVTTLLCLGLTSLTYRYIERPFLVRKVRLDGRGTATDALAA